MTVRQLLRRTLYLLRPRNPQITTYFNNRITPPRKGRPSDAMLRATQDRRPKNVHAS